MKYLLTIAILILFTAGMRAQDNSVYNNDDDNGAIVAVEKITASGAGLNTTFMKKHQGEFKVSELILKKENKIDIPKICQDDDTCSDNNSSCHTDSFIWGAISVVAGLLAFAGIKK